MNKFHLYSFHAHVNFGLERLSENANILKDKDKYDSRASFCVFVQLAQLKKQGTWPCVQLVKQVAGRMIFTGGSDPARGPQVTDQWFSFLQKNYGFTARDIYNKVICKGQINCFWSTYYLKLYYSVINVYFGGPKLPLKQLEWSLKNQHSP